MVMQRKSLVECAVPYRSRDEVPLSISGGRGFFPTIIEDDELTADHSKRAGLGQASLGKRSKSP
jgi:hypothetical protein